jgi:hypothetical protein
MLAEDIIKETKRRSFYLKPGQEKRAKPEKHGRSLDASEGSEEHNSIGVAPVVVCP